MKFRSQRFNLYLLAALAAAAVCGCRTSSPEEDPKKQLSTLRLHLEADRDSTKASEPVPIYRQQPIMLNVEKTPFLTEGDVSGAKLIDVVGGYAIQVQFNHRGATELEECTVQNRGRRIAIFCQFGVQIKDYRWLAAPVITHRIADGVLVFTPDATREEAGEIALGLNNTAEKIKTWVDK